MAEDVRYVAIQPAAASGGFNPGRAASWLLLLSTLAMLIIGGFVSWRWFEEHLFGMGLEDAGTTTVDQATLLESVRSFELVTRKDTYDTRSNTDFHQRLNLGVAKVGLPGFIAGQELDVEAEVTVSAGVDLSQVRAEDIQVIQQGDDAVVVVRIPEAQLTSTEVNPDSFDISTGKGLLNRLGGAVGLGGPDVRDGALSAVTGLAREEALRGGILTQARSDARDQLQAFLQSLPQPGNGQVTYLVEYQAAPAH